MKVVIEGKRDSEGHEEECFNCDKVRGVDFFQLLTSLLFSI